MDRALENSIKRNILIIETFFDDKAKFEFMLTPEENLALYHFGFGTWIRNFILRNDVAVYMQFLKNGIYHEDEMSFIAC